MTVKEMLSKLKYHEITPIQKGVFNAFNSPKHLVGLAPTGTGKTHAYLLPILAAIDLNQMVVQALIIVPTNELVLQVHKMLMEADDRFIVKTYYGGTNKMREQEWLKKYQPQIVIATPQQIVDYVNETRLLRIHQAKYVVFDEADMMFDEAFLSMIDQMLPAMEKAKYLLFSATLNQSMTPFIKTYFGNIVIV
jgi:ATP-dependent RNA helicase CshB